MSTPLDIVVYPAPAVAGCVAATPRAIPGDVVVHPAPAIAGATASSPAQGNIAAVGDMVSFITLGVNWTAKQIFVVRGEQNPSAHTN